MGLTLIKLSEVQKHTEKYLKFLADWRSGLCSWLVVTTEVQLLPCLLQAEGRGLLSQM